MMDESRFKELLKALEIKEEKDNCKMTTEKLGGAELKKRLGKIIFSMTNDEGRYG